MTFGSDPESMTNRLADFCRSDLGLLVFVGAARLVLHIATNNQYGFHRDELQTLDDARHLDWGFVAYPPVTPLIGRFELLLFGTSLVGFRVFSALAVSLLMGRNPDAVTHAEVEPWESVRAELIGQCTSFGSLDHGFYQGT